MLGIGKMNKLNILARLTLINLWVLPVSMRIETLLFLICPFIFSVCGWDIPVCWFFLCSIESHSLKRMGTSGQGPGYGTSPALGDSNLSWVSILLNGDIWSGTRMWNQSSAGGLSLELCDHFVEWRNLVRDQDVEPVQHWETQPRTEWPFFEWRHLVI